MKSGYSADCKTRIKITIFTKDLKKRVRTPWSTKNARPFHVGKSPGYFEDFILIKYYESRGKLPAMFLLGLSRRNQAWRKIGEPWYKLRLE